MIFLLVSNVAAQWISPSSLDPSFAPPNSFRAGIVGSVGISSDGRILVLSDLPVAEAENRRLVWLKPDGSIQGALGPEYSLDPKGRLWRGQSGRFSIGSDGAVWVWTDIPLLPPSLVRYQADGSVEANFRAPAIRGGQVYDLLAEPDGGVLIGGTFTQVEGLIQPWICRLDRLGRPDPSFRSPYLVGKDSTTELGLFRLGRHPDGGAFVSGTIESPDGVLRRVLHHLDRQGRIDSHFAVPRIEAGHLTAFLARRNGELIAALVEQATGGIVRSTIRSFRPDGTPSPIFKPSTAEGEGAILTLLEDSMGRVYAVGKYTWHDGRPARGLIRLHSDGSVDPSLRVPESFISGVSQAALQPNDDLVVLPNIGSTVSMSPGGIFRLLANGPAPSAPSISRQPASVAAALGEDVVLRAEVAGYPEPEVLWHRNGVLIAQTSRPELILPEVGPEVRGFYQLTVSNAIGSASSHNAEIAILPHRVRPGSIDRGYVYQTGVRELVEPSAVVPWRLLATMPGGRLFLAKPTTIDGILTGAELINLDAQGLQETTWSLPGQFAAIWKAAGWPDGSAMVFGVNSTLVVPPVGWLIRLTPIGTIDPSFRAQFQAVDFVEQIIPQADGRVVLAGSFALDTGPRRNRLVRLLPDGAPDPTFAPAPQIEAGSGMSLVQPDGRILICSATSASPGTRTAIQRLNPDGSIDATFNSRAGTIGSIASIAVQSDGRILVCGDFSVINDKSQPRIARLTTDGIIDVTFRPPEPDAPVKALALTASGRIVIGGAFARLGPLARNRIARLHADGAVDLEFDSGSGTDGDVEFLHEQPDGRVIVAGPFMHFDGHERHGLARIHTGASHSGLLRLVVESGSRVESDPRPLAVQVERVGGAVGPLHGNIGLRWRETPGDVPEPSVQRFTFAAGEAGPRQLEIALGGNNHAHGDRTLEIWVESNPPGRVSRSGATASIRILDDDVAYDLAPGPLATNESAGLLRFSLRRFGATNQLSQVRVSAQDGDARAGVDYQALEAVIRFEPGEQLKPLALTLLDNTRPEPDRWLTLRIQDLMDAGSPVGQELARLGILDDDAQVGPDPLFATHTAALGLMPERVNALAAPAEDGVLVVEGGNRWSMADQRLWRLREDGSVDQAFQANRDLRKWLTELPVSALATHLDGKFVIAFDWQWAYAAIGLIRLHRDGRWDETFDARGSAMFARIDAIARDSSGRILAAGLVGRAGEFRAQVMRFLPDGRHDETFAVATLIRPHLFEHPRVAALLTDPQDRLLIAGSFDLIAGFERPSLARLLPDGTVDKTFDPRLAILAKPNATLTGIACQADGKVLVAGRIPVPWHPGLADLVRLESDGRLDLTFDSALNSRFGSFSDPATAPVRAFALSPSGVLWVGGESPALNLPDGGVLAQLKSDGSLPAESIASRLDMNSVQKLLARPDGSLLIVGEPASSAASPILLFRPMPSNDSLPGRRPPRVFAPPESVVVTEGAIALFRIGADGSGPLRYRWCHEGKPIPGATGPWLALENVGTTNAGWYEVAVEGPDGLSVHAGARLTVVPERNREPLADSLRVEPLQQTVRTGMPATLHVVHSIAPEVRFQWYTNNKPLAGETNSTLLLREATVDQAGAYWVMISNADTIYMSHKAVLQVSSPTEIGLWPPILLSGHGLRIGAAEGDPMSRWVLETSSDLATWQSLTRLGGGRHLDIPLPEPGRKTAPTDRLFFRLRAEP